MFNPPINWCFFNRFYIKYLLIYCCRFEFDYIVVVEVDRLKIQLTINDLHYLPPVFYPQSMKPTSHTNTSVPKPT